MGFLSRLSRSLPWIIGLNFSLLAISIGTGWFTAAFSHPEIDLRIGSAPGWMGSTLRGEFGFVAAWNLRVMGTIVLGVCTFGVFSVVELVWIGFRFGMDVFAISQGSRWVLPYFLTYAPLEASAFTLSASAAQSFSLSVVRFFFLKEPLRIRGVLLVLAAAIVLLLAAALLEAHAQQAIKSIILRERGG